VIALEKIWFGQPISVSNCYWVGANVATGSAIALWPTGVNDTH
jgi:hypothetical protein